MCEWAFHLNWTLFGWEGPSDWCDTLILGSLSCKDDWTKFLVKSSSFDSARLYWWWLLVLLASVLLLTVAAESSCEDWCTVDGAGWLGVLALRKATWASVEQILSSGVLIWSDSLSLFAVDLDWNAFEKRRPFLLVFRFDCMCGLSTLTDLVLNMWSWVYRRLSSLF